MFLNNGFVQIIWCKLNAPSFNTCDLFDKIGPKSAYLSLLVACYESPIIHDRGLTYFLVIRLLYVIGKYDRYKCSLCERVDCTFCDNVKLAICWIGIVNNHRL